MNEEYVMYIIVNDDLKMQKGKLCAQVGHIVCELVRILEKTQPAAYIEWYHNHQPKIVLKASEEQIRDMLDNKQTADFWCKHIIDLGRTQVPSGSLTAIGFVPIKRSDAPQFIKDLKLL